MPIRTPNDPNYAKTILTALRLVIVSQTQLAANAPDGTGLGQVYIRDLLSLSQGNFPAVNLRTGPQLRRPAGYRVLDGTLTARLDYYDVWDESPLTIPAIRAQIIADVERMCANVESDQTLSAGSGHDATRSLLQYTIDDDRAVIDKENVPGRVCVVGGATFVFNLLPYDVG